MQALLGLGISLRNWVGKYSIWLDSTITHIHRWYFTLPTDLIASALYYLGCMHRRLHNLDITKSQRRKIIFYKFFLSLYFLDVGKTWSLLLNSLTYAQVYSAILNFRKSLQFLILFLYFKFHKSIITALLTDIESKYKIAPIHDSLNGTPVYLGRIVTRSAAIFSPTRVISLEIFGWYNKSMSLSS